MRHLLMCGYDGQSPMFGERAAQYYVERPLGNLDSVLCRFPGNGRSGVCSESGGREHEQHRRAAHNVLIVPLLTAETPLLSVRHNERRRLNTAIVDGRNLGRGRCRGRKAALPESAFPRSWTFPNVQRSTRVQRRQPADRPGGLSYRNSTSCSQSGRLRTSRGLLPSGGPMMPSRCMQSRMRAARP